MFKIMESKGWKMEKLRVRILSSGRQLGVEVNGMCLRLPLIKPHSYTILNVKTRLLNRYGTPSVHVFFIKIKNACGKNN